VTSQSPEAALEHLDDEQRAVATALSGPVVVLAGAGTGKTRAITHRIAYAVAAGEHDARRTLAVTFTARASGEMRSRLRVLGVNDVAVRTFHAAALRQLRYFWPRLSGQGFPELLPSKIRLVSEAAASCGVSVSPTVLRDLSSDIEWAKVSELTPRDLATDVRGRNRSWAVDAADVARVYAAYDELKSRRGRLDFEDVLLVTVGALQTRPDIADEVRKAYRWFTVDEFQDVNPLQRRLLELWRGDRDDVCVVGDVSQTIYSFTGATSDYLLNFRKDFPGAAEVRLVNCYRCTEPIVQLANSVIAQAPTAATLRLRSTKASGLTPTVSVNEDDVDEANAIAERIRGYLDAGKPARDIAVLFRINAQSADIESAMSARGIPVVMRGVERFFDRPEIREAITRLRGAARAGEATGPVAEEVRSVLLAAGWSEETPTGGGAVRERWESLSALVSLADEHPDLDVSGFIAELDHRSEVQHAPTADAVTLSSMHSAKGLEWDTVFIVGCSEGLLPLSHASSQSGDESQVDEERRLFYVGITRAKNNLHLSWAKARQPGGRASRSASRFLVATNPDALSGSVGASVTKGSRGARTERQRKGPAKCRVCGKGLVTAPERTLGRCRTCPSDFNMELWEALKRWRLATAKEREVPAYVVFTDATLMAIVEQQPATLEALADITGIGPTKLDAYGSALLSILDGV
jgi:DNA helicase-2/ATP-dependent DNA helicase PcrA